MITHKEQTDAQEKLSKFLLSPSNDLLLTLEEYNNLDPYDKGYANYLQSAWGASEIPEDVNPFVEGTEEHEEFKKGSFACMMEVQEIDN